MASDMASRESGALSAHHDRVAVVAGGASGIGAATARLLASRGARVVVADRATEHAAVVASEIEDAGGRAIAVGVDIADAGSVRDLFVQVDRAFGAVSMLFNVAADMEVLARDSDLLTMELDTWDRTFAVDLRGYVLTLREALPRMVAAGGGAIVNTSSGAVVVGEPQRPAYAAAKAGVEALTRHVAARWGRDGVRCNAVAPGLVDTPRARANAADIWEQAAAANPTGRLGVPADIAGAVAYLLGDDAGWVNGQVLHVGGGAVMR